MIAIMNIQQYMTPEILGPLTFLSVLFVALLNSIQIKKISEISEHYEHEDEEEDVKYEAHMEKPSSGQTWYQRMSIGCPWAIETDSVKIMAVRGGWLQYLDEESTTTTIEVEEFVKFYMKDDHGDFKSEEPVKQQEPVLEKTEEETLPEKSEKVEIAPETEFNVIKIHGEDFVLTPVEKKNDQ